MKYLFIPIACLSFFTPNIKFRGIVDATILFSHLHKSTAQYKEVLNKKLKIYHDKMPLLTAYFEAINAGRQKEAKKILSADTALSKINQSELSIMFIEARMQDLGVLYKPCVIVDDKSHPANIIICTEAQRSEFAAHSNEQVYTLECILVGNLIADNYKAYELISYKK